MAILRFVAYIKCMISTSKKQRLQIILLYIYYTMRTYKNTTLVIQTFDYK